MKTPPNTPPQHVSLGRPPLPPGHVPTTESLAAELRFAKLYKLADTIRARTNWDERRCIEEAAREMGPVPTTE